MIHTLEEVIGHPLPHKIVGRRPGDVAISFADVTRAKKELNWGTQKGLNEMCADSWR